MTLDELKAVRDKFKPYVKSWKRDFRLRIKMQLPREHNSLNIERSDRAKNIIEIHQALSVAIEKLEGK